MGTKALPLQQKRAWICHIFLKAVMFLQHFEVEKMGNFASSCFLTHIFFIAFKLYSQTVLFSDLSLLPCCTRILLMGDASKGCRVKPIQPSDMFDYEF